MCGKILLSILIITLFLSSCSIDKLYQKKQTRTSPFEQVDFQALVKRYLKKDKSNSIEGIYSVSGSVTKKSKGLLSSVEKEKITDRRDNYAVVAILRDPGETGRDFIELSMDKELQSSYSIVGQFTTTAGGSLLLYKHLDAKNKNSSFTFTADQNGDILEGVRVDTEGATTITYRLTYVKTYPK